MKNIFKNGIEYKVKSTKSIHDKCYNENELKCYFIYKKPNCSGTKCTPKTMYILEKIKYKG